MSRFHTMTFGTVYPLYVAKLERKGRTRDELDQVINWLTGYRASDLPRMIDTETTFPEFFAHATLNPNAHLVTGVICGVRVEDIDDPVVQNVRRLDKLVDELARGRSMERVLRTT